MREEITIKIDRSADNAAEIEKLRGLLKPYGIAVEAAAGEMWLEYDPAAVKAARTRGAGRKTTLTTYTIGQIVEYAEGHTVPEIAVLTGLSESTVKRHIRRYKEVGQW